jgi:hypothetical protein
VNSLSGWFLSILADATPSPSPTSNEPDASLVSPGWLGLLSLVFLSVAVFLLWKSMNRQFKKIDFDEASTERPPRHHGEPTLEPAAPPAAAESAPDVSDSDADQT